MTIEKRFRDTIHHHTMMRPGDLVLVAVSGGPDSTALLTLLGDAAGELGIGLHVAHLNHGWRGREADRDAAWVRRLALRRGLPVTIGRVEPGAWKRGAGRSFSLEARARTLRQRFLRDTARGVGATRIALGHTRDDQAESFLMRLLRGSGRPGLAGTYPIFDGLFVRPLLDLRRGELLAWLRRRRIRSCVDSTNRDLRRTRNRIRHRLIPRLEKEFNPEVVEALARAADLLRDEEAYLGERAAEAFARVALDGAGGSTLAVEALLGLPVALRRRVVRLAIASVRGHLRGIDREHVEGVLRLLERSGTARTGLPDGLQARIRAGRLYLGMEDPSVPGAGTGTGGLCPIPGELPLPGFGIRLRARLLKRAAGGPVPPNGPPGAKPGPGRACLDADRITGPLLVRARRPGDRFVPLNGPGTRKVKSFLIDRKVPVDERGRIPLVLSGDRIAWVVGHQIDDRFKVTPGTRRMLVLEKEPR
jgi:tRNA(Ile)-lysidine synthase